MAIERTPWQQMTPTEPWTRCSPNLLTLLAYLLAVVGGQHLGCYGVRPIRGGSSWSSHAFGSAFDWRYANVGAGYREVGEPAFRAVVLPWLIKNADRLGIQQIHDYKAARIWRTGRGWLPNGGPGMGEAWALYIHVETNAASWSNQTPINLRGVPPLTDLNPTNPPNPPTGGTVRTVSFDHAELTTSTKGPDPFVRMWQGIINARWRNGAAAIVEDGHYGPKTAAAVERAQTLAKITVDGKLGPQTARALLDR